MTSVKIPFGHVKCENIADRLDLKAGISGQRKRTGQLTDRICMVCGIEINSLDRKTLMRQIQYAWQHENASMTEPQFEFFCHGLGFNQEMRQAFLSGDTKAFKDRLEAHEFPSKFHSMYSNDFELVGEHSHAFISHDLADIDVFSASQSGYEFPLIKLFLDLIRIPEKGLKYGFQSVIIDFNFTDGRSVRLNDRIGERGHPYELETGANVYARRTNHHPRFEVVSKNKHHPLKIDEEFPHVGQLIGLNPGDVFEVSVRAELRSDILQKEGGTGDPDPELEEIQRLLFRKQLKRAAEHHAYQVTDDGQFISLVSQQIELKRNDKF